MQCGGIVKVWKVKNYQPRILYPAKLYFKNEGKLKTFPGKQNLREFVANRSSLPEKLKKILHAKKQVIPDGNWNPHDKTKSTIKGNYIGNFKR